MKTRDSSTLAMKTHDDGQYTQFHKQGNPRTLISVCSLTVTVRTALHLVSSADCKFFPREYCV